MKKDLEEENKIEDLPEEIIMRKDLKEERRTEDPQENRNNIERKDNNNLKKKNREENYTREDNKGFVKR